METLVIEETKDHSNDQLYLHHPLSSNVHHPHKTSFLDRVGKSIKSLFGCTTGMHGGASDSGLLGVSPYHSHDPSAWITQASPTKGVDYADSLIIELPPPLIQVQSSVFVIVNNHIMLILSIAITTITSSGRLKQEMSSSGLGRNLGAFLLHASPEPRLHLAAHSGRLPRPPPIHLCLQAARSGCLFGAGDANV